MANDVNYEHYVKPAKENPNFDGKLERKLVGSLVELKDLLKEKIDYIAWDLETTDLDPSKGKIVGMSFSTDGRTGYYVPIYHANGESFGKAALDIFYDKIKEAKKTFVYNMRFDFRYMEHYGFDMSLVPYYDVAVGIWLADTNHKFPSLKWAAMHFLGWKMQTFEETLGDNFNFYYVDPEDATQYAGDDAISTYLLAGVSMKYFKESKMAGKLDNQILYPLMKIEDEPLDIDIPYLENLTQKARSELTETEHAIYAMIGYTLNIGSGKQLAEALSSLGINTGEYTKAGYMRTSMKLLDKAFDETEHPVLKTIIKYKVLAKSLSSYMETTLKYAKEKEGKLRFSYHTTNVPTGRLSCGADKKNTYFAKINKQSVPKPHSRMWYVKEYEGEELLEEDAVIQGYRFSLDEISDQLVEGQDPYLNVRRAFTVPEDHMWVSIDFSGQELRIPCNISKEPVWLDAFLHGGDVHKNTAVALFGEENYNKEARGRAKICNFGILYGMSKYSLQEKFKMETLAEAEAFHTKYKKTLNTLFAWVDRHCRVARKKGVVYTYFGRPRRVKYWFGHTDSKQRAFAYRTAVNTVIQGAGSDILKIAMLKVWKKVINNPEYSDSIRFLSTIHDEINFAIHKDRLEELVSILVKLMELEVPGWQVKMAVGVEIGTSWGRCFPFEFREGRLVPTIE